MKRNLFILLASALLMLFSISCSKSDDNQVCDANGVCTTTNNGLGNTFCSSVGQSCVSGGLSGICNSNLQCQLNNGGIGNNSCIGQANGTICNINGIQGQCWNQQCNMNNGGGNGGYWPPNHSHGRCRYVQYWNGYYMDVYYTCTHY